MSAALFIVLERQIQGLDTMMNGKYLSLASKILDKVANKLKVKPLSEFFSADPAQGAEFLEDEVSNADVTIPPLQQFTAEQGLVTIRALLGYINSNPSSVPEYTGVIKDLTDCERILASAEIQGVGWHMEVDF